MGSVENRRLSSQIDLNDPLEFIKSSVFIQLQQLTWNFDEFAKRSKFLIVGNRTPDQLINIIDGILNDKGRLPLNTSNVLLLGRLRKYLADHVGPSFQTGKQAASLKWQSASEETKSRLNLYSDAELLKEAQAGIPDTLPNASLRRWYVEGFSRTWRDEGLDFLRGRLEDTGEER